LNRRLRFHHRNSPRTPRSLQAERPPRRRSPMLGTAFFSVGRRIRAHTSPERVHKSGTRQPTKPAPPYSFPTVSNEDSRKDTRRQRTQTLAGAQETASRVATRVAYHQPEHLSRPLRIPLAALGSRKARRLEVQPHGRVEVTIHTAQDETHGLAALARDRHTSTKSLRIRAFYNSTAPFRTNPVKFQTLSPTRDDSGDIRTHPDGYGDEYDAARYSRRYTPRRLATRSGLRTEADSRTARPETTAAASPVSATRTHTTSTTSTVTFPAFETTTRMFD